MSKKQKKRTKKYSGEDAKQFNRPASTESVVHRYTAVERSPLGQWWFDHKKTVRLVAIIAGVVLLIVWMIVEIVNLFT